MGFTDSSTGTCCDRGGWLHDEQAPFHFGAEFVWFILQQKSGWSNGHMVKNIKRLSSFQCWKFTAQYNLLLYLSYKWYISYKRFFCRWRTKWCSHTFQLFRALTVNVYWFNASNISFFHICNHSFFIPIFCHSANSCRKVQNGSIRIMFLNKEVLKSTESNHEKKITIAILS